VAVLIVACPCALALSRPLAAAAGLGAAARRGILFRNADQLLALARTSLVALDKTGTVTEGTLAVTEADDATLRVAAGLERYSTHPVARAIVAAVMARGISLPRGTEVREEPGWGMRGVVDGRRWDVRSHPAATGMAVRLVDDEGRGAVIHLGDALRDDAARAVAQLKAEGLEVALVTGDRREVAERVARRVGITEVHAGVAPGSKVRWIAERRGQGQRVLFAGDGLNDGPALAEADIGVAMGSGAASSILVADAVIARPGLMPLVAARRAARACGRAMRFNLGWSIAYNVAAVSAAALGLVGPLTCAILMPLSSAVVVWGSFRVEHAVRREERGR
jgi:Cu+-exporting ATPase